LLFFAAGRGKPMQAKEEQKGRGRAGVEAEKSGAVIAGKAGAV